MTDLIAKHLRGAVDDGMALGLRMAIDSLTTAQPSVAPENQTWDSAIAVLNLIKHQLETEPAGEGS